MANKENINDLLRDEIKDLYSAETQLTKAIPKMVDGANDPSLKEALSGHLRETENQVDRLEKVADILGVKPTGKKCTGMEGCIKEGAEALDQEGEEYVLDLGIIGAGCRVEHYEIAGYTTAINLAKQAGETEVVDLLNQSLAEEVAADAKLRKIASSLMKNSAVAA